MNPIAIVLMFVPRNMLVQMCVRRVRPLSSRLGALLGALFAPQLTIRVCDGLVGLAVSVLTVFLVQVLQ